MSRVEKFKKKSLFKYIFKAAKENNNESKEEVLPSEKKLNYRYSIIKAAPLTTPLDAPEPSGHAEIVNVFTDITKLELYDRTTAEEAAASFRTKASEILARSSQ
ncbi:hypothetical protein NYE69_04670 [Paenibacillus sp. FSL R5-0527]|uniref:hypothetical protein n=1 Tax=Paenibacillus sp. FSL R5-0527 TaxID=2975321 RepID=UPI000979C38A|nr:hypothetical protein BK140_26290 [Paenibacillus macerans]